MRRRPFGGTAERVKDPDFMQKRLHPFRSSLGCFSRANQGQAAEIAAAINIPDEQAQAAFH